MINNTVEKGGNRMPTPTLSIDEVLTTTRAVRRRLDLNRPVELEVLKECLEIALQAPTPGASQRWHFVVVTDPAQRLALAALYRKSFEDYAAYRVQVQTSITDGPAAAAFARMMDSAHYLTEHLQDVPVHVIPCIEGRAEKGTLMEQAGLWSAILPASWSFMLAARARGLGTVLTNLHLQYEREAAEVLGIPFASITQAALIPVAYTLGTLFKPASRKPLEEVVHWNSW
jgi:nitroreductase